MHIQSHFKKKIQVLEHINIGSAARNGTYYTSKAIFVINLIMSNKWAITFPPKIK